MKSVTLSVLAAMLLAFSMPSFAVYCDGSMIGILSKQTRIDYLALMNSSKYSRAQKENLRQDQIQWENRVNSQCRDNDCVCSSLLGRNGALINEYRRIGGK